MPITRQQRIKRQEVEDILARLEQAMPQMLDLIAVEDAVALLVDRVHAAGDLPSETRKKVIQRIDIAIKNGELDVVGDQFLFGSFINWAWTKKTWAASLRDLPALSLISGAGRLPTIGVHGYSYALPSTVAECHRALHDAHARIAQLEQEIAHRPHPAAS